MNSFEPGFSPYYGPADGLSRPVRPWARAIAGTLVRMACRVEVQGEENLAGQGGAVYCPNHPTGLDPLVVQGLAPGDLRTMAAVEVFRRRSEAALAEAMGAFPVNRGQPSEVTKQHCVDLLRDGKGLLIFPEGGAPERPGQIGRVHRGAAAFAVKGGADRMVPIALHYRADDRLRPGEYPAALLAAAGVAATVAALSASGHPALQVGASVAALGLTGGVALGAAASRLLPERYGAAVRFGFGVAAGLTGLTAGCVAGSLVALPGWASVALAGTAALAGAVGYIHRPLAQVRVGEPLKVAEFVQQHGPLHAIDALTVELHRRVGASMEPLSGVPYDDSLPKIKTRGR
ncbi:MAG: lysophospholipid acyltransferase family protein [Candidatus Eremiobacterota bacterium]